MEVGTTRRPGQKGTKRLLERFGDKLLFVRYRYDRAAGRRYTTAEIIVDEQPWAPHPATAAPALPTDPSALVAVHIEAHELNVRAKAKTAGATCDASRRVWMLPLRRARGLRLQNRIVPARS